MMDDLISRQAAIDAIDYLLQHNDDAKRSGHSQVFINGMEDGYYRVRSDILFLPSAHPDLSEYSDKLWRNAYERGKAEAEPHWIPVSERLPEYGVAVLTYDGHCFCVEKRIPTIRDDEGEPITGDWWVSDDYDEYDSDYYPNLRDGACIAWMPLPETYRAERRTDE